MPRWPVPLLVATLLFGAAGCRKSRDASAEATRQKTAPSGAVMGDSIHLELAVYRLNRKTRDPQAVLGELLKSEFKTLKLVQEIPKELSERVVAAKLETDVKSKYAPPNSESLKHAGHGLSAEQERALQEVDEALILRFAHSKDHVWDGLRVADELVEEISRNTGGLVWDAATREVFTPDAWKERRLASWTDVIPDVSTQTVVHVYQNDELARAISLGMEKMGLPDAFIEALPWSDGNNSVALINLFCQAMAEETTFDGSGKYTLKLQNLRNQRVREAQAKSAKGNATGAAYLLLKTANGDEGDPDNRLIELSAERYDGAELQVKQDKMLSCFFGWDDSVRGITHNEELLEASRKARENLPYLYKAFKAGLAPGEYIDVKVPFRTVDNGNEWMWVEITKWEGHEITGVLDNEPEKVPGLRSGQTVKVSEDDVFDFIRRFADGHDEGNTTGEIIRQMAEERPVTARTAKRSAKNDGGCTPK